MSIYAPKVSKFSLYIAIIEVTYFYFNREESDNEVDDNDNSDWTEPALQSNIDDAADDTATHSPQLLESPAKEQHHRHTPSQDSCCSNDTLFNLEELVANEQFLNNKEIDFEENKTTNQTQVHINKEDTKYIASERNDLEHFHAELAEQNLVNSVNEISPFNSLQEQRSESRENIDVDQIESNSLVKCGATSCEGDNQTHIKLENDEAFVCEPQTKQLNNDNTTKVDVLEQKDQIDLKYKYIQDFIKQERFDVSNDFSKKEDGKCRIKKHNVPLPSPEDRQWKELHAPFLTYNMQNNQSVLDDEKGTLKSKESYVNTSTHSNDPDYVNNPSYVNTSNLTNCPSYVNANATNDDVEPVNYINASNCDDILVYVEAPNYVNAPNFADPSNYVEAPCYVNAPNYAEPPNDIEKPNYVNNTISRTTMDCDGKDIIDPIYVENPIENEERLDDIYGPLTDIRFSGPCDNQLMSTSFSESNDLGDEQDWDSGSDTRSSSSGEFLWKV